MRIAVFGLGYVGSVMAGALTRDGHDVVGVDIQPDRVDQVRRGETPVTEPGLAELFEDGVRTGRLTATTDPVAAVQGCEVSLVCVGTPSRMDGLLDTRAVEGVCRQIAAALGPQRHTIAVRSTLPPGTAARIEAELVEVAGRPVPLCVVPEFLREGTALADFDSPELTVVGTSEAAWAQPIRTLFPKGRWRICGLAEAELLKAACNAWHATKVSFANEIARLAVGVGADGREVMALLSQDTRLNTSARYLRPGNAFGGSCLPKDLAALNHLARHHHLELPVLDGTARSNRVHLQRACDLLDELAPARVAFLGLAFKPDTDDLRHSPLVSLVEHALGKGRQVQIFDSVVDPDQLVGTNQAFASARLGHLAQLMAPLRELSADVYVLGHDTAACRAFVARLPAAAHVLDLTGARLSTDAQVTGLAW